MTLKLFLQAITKFILGVVMVGLLIFLPAGTFSYFNGGSKFFTLHSSLFT